MNLRTKNLIIYQSVMAIYFFLTAVLVFETSVAASAFRKVEGKILSVKEVKFKNSDKENMVILIKTLRGHEKLVVDLGDSRRIKAMIDSGSELAVEGYMVKIDQKLFMLAQKVSVEDKHIKVNRNRSFPKAPRPNTEL